MDNSVTYQLELALFDASIIFVRSAKLGISPEKLLVLLIGQANREYFALKQQLPAELIDAFPR